MLTNIKYNELDGTPQSGFVTGGQNRPPRQCGNCIWQGLESCGHPLVISDPELHPRESDGRVPVDEDDCCNGFQSRGNVLIYAIRHGDTKFNKSGAFRGWINIPLNTQGLKHAKMAAKYLEDKKIKAFYSSDLGRAVETAKTISRGKRVTKDEALRPWDVGIFSGKSKDEYQEKFNHYIDNPEKEIPQGESLKNFAERMNKVFVKYLKIAKEDGPICISFHSSNCIQLEKQAEGGNELGRPEDAERVTPGGIMVVSEEDGALKTNVVFGSSAKEANYGS